MILFSWTLTPNQVLALRSVADYQAAHERLVALKDKPSLDALRLNALDMPHWISTTRHLLREGWIVHEKRPKPNWMKSPTDYNKDYPMWTITEKGKLILQLVSLEVEDQARVLSNDRKVLKLLAA